VLDLLAYWSGKKRALSEGRKCHRGEYWWSGGESSQRQSKRNGLRGDIEGGDEGE